MRRDSGCLNEHTIFMMTEAESSSSAYAAAFLHLQACNSCSQRYREMDSVEYRLRCAAADVSALSTDASVDQAIAQVIARIHANVDREAAFAECKETLFHLLAPLCGMRLTQRSIEMASSRGGGEATHSLEDEWTRFVQNLGEILYRVCGSTVRRAVYEICGATVAGAAS